VVIGSDRRRVEGKMLWFHEERGYGFLLTDEDERLRVERRGFVDGAAPVGRCASLPVSLSIVERDGVRIAIDVAVIPEESRPRARRRMSSVRSAWS
jgi:hypothetical protein